MEPKVYNCGGHAAYWGPCGGYDCESCYGQDAHRFVAEQVGADEPELTEGSQTQPADEGDLDL